MTRRVGSRRSIVTNWRLLAMTRVVSAARPRTILETRKIRLKADVELFLIFKCLALK